MTDDNRAADRAARLLQGQQATTHQRRLKVSLITIVLVIAAVAVAGYVLSGREDAAEADAATPANSTESFGFRLTPALATGTEVPDPPVTVALYEDFLCPSCRIFEERSGAYLRDAVTQGRIVLEYRPFTFLIGASTNRYTERAANAAACVADSAGVVPYANFHDLLYANQPAEGVAGHEDPVLVDFAAQAGAPDIAACVEEERFADWVKAALAEGREIGVSQTPTVVVNDVKVEVIGQSGGVVMPGTDELEQAISQAGG
ncbi:DsbA-like protein [Aeromicrobium marinum DSM 15272]|uniref:DsbA-like protein n=1 Tax=Aeromicrobium marinum DSM 15272 TaxID=585531 RepID=E2S903_9ACTN|nr:thioredoxin domain-containing protein [Aeromicrobium marinum]EFQ84658.1 DsbA-like protein [Aeromicrobium marinum DSM 15272]